MINRNILKLCGEKYFENLKISIAFYYDIEMQILRFNYWICIFIWMNFDTLFLKQKCVKSRICYVSLLTGEVTFTNEEKFILYYITICGR